MNRRAFILGAASASAALAGDRNLSGDRSDDTIWDAPYRLQPGWLPLINGHDLQGWRSQPGWRGDPTRLREWFATSAVDWSRLYSPNQLTAKRSGGPILINGDVSRTSNLITDQKFGNFELYLEFLIPRGSNSGVYFHGLYELQIFDSYASGVAPTSGDGGGIYERWEHDKGFGGSAPLRNACRPPGEWQSFHVWFHAPRFDAMGAKIDNARFLRVLYNGLVVQHDVACDGPTRSALDFPEAPLNPLMLQGDHGPVAFRNIYYKPL